MPYFSTFTKIRDLINPSTGDAPPSSSSTTCNRNALQRTRRHLMSPTTRTERWIQGSTHKMHLQSAVVNRVNSARVTKSKTKTAEKKRASFWSLPIISTLFAQNADQKTEVDLDGDTVMKEELSETSSEDNDHTLVNDDMNEQLDFTDRFFDYNDPRVKEWSFDEVWMFNKLSRRVLEPLLSESWQWDFESYPDSLFTKHEKLVFINNLNTSITDATNELGALVQAGPRCRDALLLKQHPEPPLKKGIERYKKWSTRDGRLSRKPYIDLIAVGTAKPGETVRSVRARVTDKLYSLGTAWRSKFRQPDCDENDGQQVYTHEPPTLYGFIIKYSIVGIVSYDARMPNKPVRTLETLNFQLDGSDVWQALAISIVCVKARNKLMQLDQEGHIGEDIPDDSDPDA